MNNEDAFTTAHRLAEERRWIRKNRGIASMTPATLAAILDSHAQSLASSRRLNHAISRVQLRSMARDLRTGDLRIR